MPPERTDRERIVALEHRIGQLCSDLRSVEGDVKAARLAGQVRSSDSDEVYRIVMDENEGLRKRVRSIEEWQAEVKELKAYVSGEIRTIVIIVSIFVTLVQIALKLWK